MVITSLFGINEIAEILIAKGVDVIFKNTHMITPFGDSDQGHKETVELLLSKGADVNAQYVDRSSFLSAAVVTDHTEIANLLIDKGADLNKSDKNSATPLHYAAFNRNEEITQLLIIKGANLNGKDGFGKTSLDSSFMSDQNIIADLLRKHSGKTSEELKSKRIIIETFRDCKR